MNELSARTKDLLSAARVAMAPLPEDRERVRAALDLKLATLAAATSGSGLAAKGALKGAAVASSAGVTAKVVVVFALSAAVGGAGMHYGLRAAAAPVQEDVPVVVAPGAAAPLARATEAAPAPAAPEDVPAGPHARVEVAHPAEGRPVAPAAPVVAREGSPTTPDVPDAPSSATRTDFRSAPCTMAQELQSLRPAQQALAAHEPQKALDLLAPYFQGCGGGALEPEAHAARALALCQLEQVAQAQPDLEWLKAKGALRPKLVKTCSALPRLER